MLYAIEQPVSEAARGELPLPVLLSRLGEEEQGGAHGGITVRLTQTCTDPRSMVLVGPCLQEEKESHREAKEEAEKMRKVKIIHLSGSDRRFALTH